MTKYFPQRVANELTTVIRAAGGDEFPVDVRTIALDISREKYPEDPIVDIQGGNLPGFEGALAPAPQGKTGWGIVYNRAIASRGRINFTLGHEFGHYLLHRLDYPTGFTCSTEDLAKWESEFAQRENEANVFASTLLMPLDDFRAQIDPHVWPDFDLLGACATRYDVSLVAATLKWLQCTSRRAMLVVSRDGFILWSRSSASALKTGLYYKTRDRAPIEVPSRALAADPQSLSGSTGRRELADDAWFHQPCTEHVILSDLYDFTLSLLHFEDADRRADPLDEETEDLSRALNRLNAGRSRFR